MPRPPNHNVLPACGADHALVTASFYSALGPEFEPRGGLSRANLTDREDRTRRDLRARAYLRRKGAK